MKFNVLFWMLFLSTLVSGFAAYANPALLEVEAFINKYDEDNRRKTHTPGWVFAYVQNDEQLTASFGESDIETGRAVNVNTVFRIASVSKVFVGIAVQQLLEKQLLNLDVNIEKYLPDFPALQQLEQPVTLRHLMSHTAGFEDKFYGDSVGTEADLQSLEAHLGQALPKQIYPPGKILAYSNYGYSLAALIVEKIMAMPFHLYVQQAVLKPAGMTRSGFTLTPELEDNLATGYEFDNGQYHTQPYTWVHRYPSTSMLTTAGDMAKLIAVLVNKGIGESGQVLSETSLQHMFSTLFSHDSDLPGMALGWMEFQRYGNRMYYHDGGTPGFVAQLVIMPDKNAGYFIAANQKNSALPGSLRFDFLKSYYHKEPGNPRDYQPPPLPLSRYAGSYQNTRKNLTSFEAFAQLMSREVKVGVSEDGDSLRYWDRDYQSYGENRFVHEESGHILVFNTDGNVVTHLFQDWGGAPRSFQKLAQYQTRYFHLVTLCVIMGLNLAALIFALMARRPLSARNYNVIANGLMLLFFISLGAYSWQLESVNIRLAEIGFLKILLVLPILAGSCALLSVVKHNRSVVHIIMILPVLAGTAWLYQFNLLGWYFY